MEKAKSRRPGVQTTIRKIPSQAVKTKNRQRADLTRTGSSPKRRRRRQDRMSYKIARALQKRSGKSRKGREIGSGQKAGGVRPTTAALKQWTVGSVQSAGEAAKRTVAAGRLLTQRSSDRVVRRKQRVYKQRLAISAVAAAVVLFFLSVLVHAFRFNKNTYVNGVNVSGLGAAAAARQLEQAGTSYSIEIRGAGDVRGQLTDANLGLKILDTKGLKEAMKEQNPFTWFVGRGKKKSYTVEVKTAFDENRLQADLAALDIFDQEQMRAPVDASLRQTDDGRCEIVPEQEGSTFDVAAASDLIGKAVASYQRTVDISSAQIHPEVYRDNENLVSRFNQWNKYLESAGISFNFPAGTVSLDSKDIASLLTDDGDEVTVSYSKVAVLIADWRKTYDTYNNSFSFKTRSGKVIDTWYEGDYGFELNQEDTAKNLIDFIKAGDKGNHDPKWYHKGASMENMGLGDTYVEVSLEDQHIWVYKDGKVVVDTDVVTGNPNPDEKGRNRQTYKGCYAVKGKYEDVVLGTLDVQGYASPVSYWIPFNGGEGFHDAPWRDSFGGQIYLNNGSHGCVNCPKEVMSRIFENISRGEAVIIY